MKAGELRDLTLEEVRQKHDEWQTEYFRMRVKHALGQLENPLLLRGIRKDIARAKTLLAEDTLAEDTLADKGKGKGKSQPKAGSDN